MKVFISYRRSDTLSQANRLADELQRKFGEDAVFLDTEDIRGGEAWPDRLRHEVENASVVLVLMGEGWLSALDEHFRRRISLPDDWVRREVATALASKATVVPICVNDCLPIAADALSDVEGLAGLADLNIMHLHEGHYWRADVTSISQRLIALGFELAPDSPDAITAELLAAKDESEVLRQQLSEAVSALQDERDRANSNQQARIDIALAHLRGGDSDAAEAVFDDITQQFEEGSADAAAAYRHKGALAFLHDSNKALKAYQRATELEPDNLDGWNQLGQLLDRTGVLDEAIRAYNTVLQLAAERGDEPSRAVAYGNLSSIYKTRGDLEESERLCRKALDINETLGLQEGIASQYGNLGLFYKVRGDLDCAERLFRKALEINEALGRQEGMASQYGNLGLIYKTRGNLDEAERLFRKALELNDALGRQEGIAKQYGNLGFIYQARGDLTEAEHAWIKALNINEALGRQEGMATQYSNLGFIHEMRGDLGEAERLCRKALQINEALGRKEGLAIQYGNLGNIHRARGDLDEAERLCRKSLEINAGLRRQEGMAIQYANLGKTYQRRGDLDEAERLYRNAYELFSALGSPEASKAKELLDSLHNDS